MAGQRNRLQDRLTDCSDRLEQSQATTLVPEVTDSTGTEVPTEQVTTPATEAGTTVEITVPTTTESITEPTEIPEVPDSNDTESLRSFDRDNSVLNRLAKFQVNFA